jgi:hypothetical protein
MHRLLSPPAAIRQIKCKRMIMSQRGSD